MLNTHHIMIVNIGATRETLPHSVNITMSSRRSQVSRCFCLLQYSKLRREIMRLRYTHEGNIDKQVPTSTWTLIILMASATRTLTTTAATSTVCTHACASGDRRCVVN